MEPKMWNQGNSPSVTKGTSGVAVVGTRGELNRWNILKVWQQNLAVLVVFNNYLLAWYRFIQQYWKISERLFTKLVEHLLGK